MKHKIILTFISILANLSIASSQSPDPALIGYWHNWNDPGAPYIQLDQVDPRYTMICLAFAVPSAGTDYKMEFIPDQVNAGTLISQIQTLQSANKKVLISIGGATAPIVLNNLAEKDTFIATMSSIINTYGFDGMDIDLEGSSLSVSGGTIAAPADSSILNLIDAVKTIMHDYYISHNKKLILTMAPETAFVQGGIAAYGGIWGAYLPVIDALRDSIEILHVQLYNSGNMTGIDGHNYNQGTSDFIIAMTEAVIHGFQTSGGYFNGLPAHKVAVGLPACPSAAGGGYTDTASVRKAINYLRGIDPVPPGTCILSNTSGYPDLRGMMTWSINWDAVSFCASAYQYADNYTTIFGSASNTVLYENQRQVFTANPNPASSIITIGLLPSFGQGEKLQLFNSIGSVVSEFFVNGNSLQIDISGFQKGVYTLKSGNYCQKIVHF